MHNIQQSEFIVLDVCMMPEPAIETDIRLGKNTEEACPGSKTLVKLSEQLGTIEFVIVVQRAYSVCKQCLAVRSEAEDGLVVLDSSIDASKRNRN
jgi:hypothetical protein